MITLSQAIAAELVGTPNPTCEVCSAPAFISYDRHLYCKAYWQQGQCADPDDSVPPPWENPVLIAGYSSGDLDLPAIGRRLARLDRGGLTAYLASTPRRFWPMLARALALVIEPNAADHAETEAGMIWHWSGLVTWHQAGPSR